MTDRQTHLRRMTGALACLLAAACGGYDGPGSVADADDSTGAQTTTTAPTGEPTTGGDAVCGDGVVDPGEGCDDGDANGEAAACTPACQPAVCGDGLVRAGVEACDDANQSDADGCTNACQTPTCGDGVVSSGEDCDDGDDDNGDACLVGCKLAACGDGYVREGFELCDDGDADNGDACLADCTLATCGDGYVHVGVEACDDGNDDPNDACTDDCKTPATCDDGLLNGAETDLDCGGPNCPGCADDQACNEGSDCASTFCALGACVTPKHCRDIRDLDLGKADGVYPVDPDGPGELAPMTVYCEQSFNGGGWTAVFNMRELPVGEAAADKLLAALATNAPAEPVMPNSNSAAVYTEGLALDLFTEVLFGWAPSGQADVTRWAKLTDPAGLEGLCYLDGYCGPGVAIGTFDLVPTGNARVLSTGKATDFPHVGLGFDDQTIVWGYDRNANNLSNWANLFDEGPCCKAGNTADINVPGWRYAIYLR